MGMDVGSVTTENGVEVPQKTKNGIIIPSSNPTPGQIPRQNYNHKSTCSPIFKAAPFTIAKKWKRSKYPLTDDWTQM